MYTTHVHVYSILVGIYAVYGSRFGFEDVIRLEAKPKAISHPRTQNKAPYTAYMYIPTSMLYNIHVCTCTCDIVSAYQRRTDSISLIYRIAGNFHCTNVSIYKISGRIFSSHTCFIRLQRMQQWKTKKRLLFLVTMGVEAIAITSSCIMGNLVSRSTVVLLT